MLTKDSLLSFLYQGAKAKGMEGIGIEYEIFLMRQGDFAPVEFHTLSAIIATIHMQATSCKTMIEADNTLGLLFPDGATISLEPAGQIEFTTPPLLSLGALHRYITKMYTMIEQAAKKHGCILHAIGFTPNWREDEVFHIPKKRYDIMRDYMPSVGRYSSEIMHRCCSLQANFDFHNEQDMINKVRLILLVQPILGAFFSHSPLVEGMPFQNLSARRHFWLRAAPHSHEFATLTLDDAFGFDIYLDYMLSLPTHIVSHRGDIHSVNCCTFEQYMHGALPELRGKYPTLKDFQYHISTIFPDVRLKPFIETRNLDSAPWGVMSSSVAILIGLLYDETAMQEALSALGCVSPSTLQNLHKQSILQGMEAMFRGQSLWQWAKLLCSIAHDGLKRRASIHGDETPYLQAMINTLDEKVPLAQHLLERYQRGTDAFFTQSFF